MPMFSIKSAQRGEESRREPLEDKKILAKLDRFSPIYFLSRLQFLFQFFFFFCCCCCYSVLRTTKKRILYFVPIGISKSICSIGKGFYTKRAPLILLFSILSTYLTRWLIGNRKTLLALSSTLYIFSITRSQCLWANNDQW